MVCGKVKQIKDTKDRLFLSLISLMKDKSYEEIKIKDILEISQVSRRTFYRHFTNKQELLNYYFEKGLHTIIHSYTDNAKNWRVQFQQRVHLQRQHGQHEQQQQV